MLLCTVSDITNPHRQYSSILYHSTHCGLIIQLTTPLPMNQEAVINPKADCEILKTPAVFNLHFINHETNTTTRQCHEMITSQKSQICVCLEISVVYLTSCYNAVLTPLEILTQLEFGVQTTKILHIIQFNKTMQCLISLQSLQMFGTSHFRNTRNLTVYHGEPYYTEVNGTSGTSSYLYDECLFTKRLS